MNPWGLLLAGAGMIALATGAFFTGDSVGANRVIARDAKANEQAAKDLKKSQDQLAAALDVRAIAEGNRQQSVREIYRDIPTIVDRPVYRTVCVDDGGVQLLDRAAAAADGGGRSGTAGAAGNGTESVAHD